MTLPAADFDLWLAGKKDDLRCCFCSDHIWEGNKFQRIRVDEVNRHAHVGCVVMALVKLIKYRDAKDMSEDRK